MKLGNYHTQQSTIPDIAFEIFGCNIRYRYMRDEERQMMSVELS